MNEKLNVLTINKHFIGGGGEGRIENEVYPKDQYMNGEEGDLI